MKNQTYDVDRLLKEAMSMMGEEPRYRDDYETFVVDIANTLMADLFDVNNTMREQAKKQPLACVPVVQQSREEIPYEYLCIKNIMVYGLAFWLLYHDGESDKANIQNAVYEDHKKKFSTALYQQIDRVL